MSFVTEIGAVAITKSPGATASDMEVPSNSTDDEKMDSSDLQTGLPFAQRYDAIQSLPLRP